MSQFTLNFVCILQTKQLYILFLDVIQIAVIKDKLDILGMSNEFELEKVGIDLVEKKQLWAAVVFTNLDDNPSSDYLPEFIQVNNFQKVKSKRF